MPSPFSARDARVSGAIDSAFGELFVFDAMSLRADVNLPAITDGVRIQFTWTGVWEGPAMSRNLPARGAPDEAAMKRSAPRTSISIDDAGLPWAPQKHDRVTRLFDGSVYLVDRAMPDGMGRVTIHLTAQR